MGDTLDDPMAAMMDAFDEGMALYRSRNWTDAVRCFQRCLELRTTDGPSRIYRDRCLAFQANPPPSDWDGVTDLEEK
jgi:adenylate cyclase